MRKRHKPVIVLDAGGVLVNFSYGVLLKELSERFGREIRVSIPLELDPLFSPLQVGAQSWEEVIPGLNETIGLSLSSREWRELCCHIFTGEVEGMRNLLCELKDHFHLVALSNTIDVHWDYLLRQYPIFKLLDGWVVSYEEGLEKPHPAIYQRVTDRYCDGALPLFYTDDILPYVQGARRLGWEAEVFSNAQQLRQEVDKRRRHLTNRAGKSHDPS